MKFETAMVVEKRPRGAFVGNETQKRLRSAGSVGGIGAGSASGTMGTGTATTSGASASMLQAATSDSIPETPSPPPALPARSQTQVLPVDAAHKNAELKEAEPQDVATKDAARKDAEERPAAVTSVTTHFQAKRIKCASASCQLPGKYFEWSAEAQEFSAANYGPGTAPVRCPVCRMNRNLSCKLARRGPHQGAGGSGGGRG
jgi:hypothetical protein